VAAVATAAAGWGGCLRAAFASTPFLGEVEVCVVGVCGGVVAGGWGSGTGSILPVAVAFPLDSFTVVVASTRSV